MDLNFTILNLTNYNKHIWLTGLVANYNHYNQTSSMNKNMATKGYKEVFKPINEMI